MKSPSTKASLSEIFLMLVLVGASIAAQPATSNNARKDHNEWTGQQLQAAMATGKLSSFHSYRKSR